MLPYALVTCVMELFPVIIIIIRDIAKIKYFVLIFPWVSAIPWFTSPAWQLPDTFPCITNYWGVRNVQEFSLCMIYPRICQHHSLYVILTKASILSSFKREERNFFSWKCDSKIIIFLQMLDTAQEQNPRVLFLNSLWAPLHYLPMHTWSFLLGTLIIFQPVGPKVNSHTREGVNIFRAKSACLKADLSVLVLSECSSPL